MAKAMPPGSKRGKPDGEDGLFVLYPEDEEHHIEADIVTVHGLGGDAFGTWTSSNNTMWPRDFLPTLFPDVRIMTFGYNSKWAFSPSVADVDDFALDLLNKLRIKRWSIQAMNRPIIFICHSLGGIVCKKALIRAKTTPYYENIFEKTQAILFFGCPHRGSRVASWATVMSNFINTCTFHQPVRRKLLEDLSLSSKILADISVSFKFIATNLEIKTFYETEAMAPLKGPVVERESAVLGIINEQSIPIAADHREMVRFSHIKSQKFESVHFALKELIEGGPKEDLELANFYLRRELRVTDYDQQLASIGMRAPDTCEWLPQNPTFSHWLHSTKSEVLWLRGLPGVGKTVLTKYLITSVITSEWVLSSISGQVRKSEGRQNAPFLGYFFCSERDREQQLEENILFSMLHQLIIGEPEITASLLSFKETGRSRLFTFLSDNSRLWAAVKSVLVASKRETIFLVLDALDEMESQSMLTFATRLRSMIDAIAPRIEPRSVKLLLTSRPKPELDEILCCPSISVRNERDVRHYVETRADYLVDAFGVSASLRAEVVESICKKAGSMFLWARLAWDQFCQGLTDAASVRRNMQKVDRLPPSLHSLYEELLNRHDNADLAVLRNIFAWLITSSRPLTVREMRFAISLKNAKSLAEAHTNMLGEAQLSSIAPSLISVDAAHHVQFTHQSVKDFLLSSETSPRYQLRLDKVHSNIATSCLRCFTLPDFDAAQIRRRLCNRKSRDSEEMHDVSQECELLLYASTNWPYHAKIAGRNPDIWQAFQSLTNATESMRLWTMLYLYDGSVKCQQVWHEQQRFSEIPPPLHIAAYLGNRYLMEKLLASGINVNEVYERSKPEGGFTLNIPAGTVLHLPGLDAETIAFLIENGADPEVKNSTVGHNALLQAIRDRNERLSTALLASGDARFLRSSGTKSSNSILLAAVDAQLESVVTAILNNPQVDPYGPTELGYETTTSGVYFTGPLEHACLFGMESMARLLFAHPRVIEAQQRKDEEYPGVNPTSLAFITLLQGWEDLTLQAIQKFPIDLGNDLDKDRRTLLHHAVIEQWHEVLEACLARMPKSKLNMMDKNGMTPLHYAGSTRNWYAAQRCIEAGAQLHLEDNYGRTPAHVAAEVGSERVLRYILEKDPTVASEVDHKKRTVLHYVATWNLFDIAETLVSQAGASVAVKDCDGRTAAHLAAMFGSSAVLALVLSTGFIDANARDAYGNSLLHCAVESRTTSCIEVLLWREDVQLNALNCHGKSPLDVTFSYIDDKLAAQTRELLESAGCTKGLWRPPRRSYAHTARVSKASRDVEYDPENIQLALVVRERNFRDDRQS